APPSAAASSRARAIAPEGTAMSRSAEPSPESACRTAPPASQAGRPGPRSRASATSAARSSAPKPPSATRAVPVTAVPGARPRGRERSAGRRCGETRAPASGPHHPGPRPAGDLDAVADTSRPGQTGDGAGRFLGLESEETNHAGDCRIHGAVEVAHDQQVERGGPAELPPLGYGIGQPLLNEIPPIRKGGLVALFRLYDPQALLELRHRPLEFPRPACLEHERVRPQAARVLGTLAEEAVHEPLGRRRHAARPVFGGVVTRALAAPHEGVEGREEIERDQNGAPLDELAI